MNEVVRMIIRILAVYLPFIIFYFCALSISFKISLKYELHNNYLFMNKYEDMYITFQDELLFAVRHLSISLLLIYLLCTYKVNGWQYEALYLIPITLEFFVGMSALEFVLNFIKTTRGK